MTQITRHVLRTLMSTASWVNAVVQLCADSKYFPYETTGVVHYPEVTIRKPTGSVNRWGKASLKRYRMDLVSLIQITYKRWRPIVVGVEIKTTASDLRHDTKMHEYISHVDRFYLAVPSKLMPVAREYVVQRELSQIGILSIHHNAVKVHRHSADCTPDETALAGLFQELCMHQFDRRPKPPWFVNQVKL